MFAIVTSIAFFPVAIGTSLLVEFSAMILPAMPIPGYIAIGVGLASCLVPLVLSPTGVKWWRSYLTEVAANALTVIHLMVSANAYFEVHPVNWH